jgi:hypothetical protein
MITVNTALIVWSSDEVGMSHALREGSTTAMQRRQCDGDVLASRRNRTEPPQNRQ